MVWYGMAGRGQFFFRNSFHVDVGNFERKKMKLESFGLEALENIAEHTRISEQVREVLLNICAKFDKYECFSPWKGAVEKVLKNGKKLTVGNAGAKALENSNGDLLVYRKFSGYDRTLPDGTPTLRFYVDRPSGRTRLVVKPRVDGGFSPVRL